MKNTLTKNKRQLPKHARTQLDACFLFQPEESFKNKLTPAEFKTFNELLWYASRYEIVFPSQGTIAKSIGYTRQTVNEAIARLIHLGLITKIQRWKTWTYAISAWFNSAKTKRRLAILFPVLTIGLPAITRNTESITVFKNNPTVTSRNNKEIRITKESSYLPSLAIFKSSISCLDLRAPVTKQQKKELVMSEEFSPMLDKLPFKLTLYGKIKLSSFPDSVLQSSSDNYRKKKNIKDPFAFFFRLCLDELRNKKIAGLWRRYYAFVEQYGMPEDAIFIEKAPLIAMVNEQVKQHREVLKPKWAGARLEYEQDRIKYDLPAEDDNSKEAIEKRFVFNVLSGKYAGACALYGSDHVSMMWSKFLEEIGSSKEEALAKDFNFPGLEIF